VISLSWLPSYKTVPTDKGVLLFSSVAEK